jgi:hypothetical protein
MIAPISRRWPMSDDRWAMGDAGRLQAEESAAGDERMVNGW